MAKFSQCFMKYDAMKTCPVLNYDTMKMYGMSGGITP
jgi:hypothetical protein